MRAVCPRIFPPVQFDSVTSTQELLVSSLLLKSLCFFPKGSIRVLFLFPFENTALKCSLSWYRTLLWSYYMCNQQGYTYPTISWSTCGQLSPQSLLFLASPCLFGESYHCSENFFVHQVFSVWKWCINGPFSCFSLYAKWSPSWKQTFS